VNCYLIEARCFGGTSIILEIFLEVADIGHILLLFSWRVLPCVMLVGLVVHGPSFVLIHMMRWRFEIIYFICMG